MCLSISLTAFPVLQPLSRWPFCNYPFVLPNPFAPFTQAPRPLPSDRCQSALCVYESVSVLLVYLVQLIPHGSDIRWRLSFSDQLTSLSMTLRAHPCCGTELLLQSRHRTCASPQLSGSNRVPQSCGPQLLTCRRETSHGCEEQM